MGLRIKLALYVVIFVTVGLAILGYLRVQAERDIYVQEMKNRGVTLMRSFAIPCTVAMANNDTPTLDNYVSQFASASSSMDLDYMAVLDYDARVAAHTRAGEFGKHYDDPFTRQAVTSEEPQTQLTETERGPILEITVPVISGLRWGTLRAGFTLAKMENSLAQRQTQAVLTAVAVSLGAVIIAYLALSLLVIRPLLRMTDMTKRFGAGMLDARVESHQNDEMGELAEHLNGMAEQIQGYTGSLERLVEERTSELNASNEKLRDANHELDQLARTDGLTGLFNRRHFDEQLAFELRRAQRTPRKFAVVLLDVDNFKKYNDSNGHTAGDELLQRLAALLQINTRATDVVARYGGEEFILMLLDTSPDEGVATARKLQRVVESQPMPHEESQPGGKLTISLGVAFFPDDAREGSELVEMADKALYLSKSRGRNCVSSYTEVTARST